MTLKSQANNLVGADLTKAAIDLTRVNGTRRCSGSGSEDSAYESAGLPEVSLTGTTARRQCCFRLRGHVAERAQHLGADWLVTSRIRAEHAGSFVD